MELEIGMYVRTINGKIWIIKSQKAISGHRKDIINASYDIIDLIEVGDYVNGEQVSRIKQCPEYHLGDGILIFNEHNETIYSNFRTSKYYDIKSIVTKEAFESMEYRIGE